MIRFDEQVRFAIAPALANRTVPLGSMSKDQQRAVYWKTFMEMLDVDLWRRQLNVAMSIEMGDPEGDDVG